MPRYNPPKAANPAGSLAEAAAPTVRRLSSSDIELTPVAVRPVAQETIELAPDPIDAAVDAVLGENKPTLLAPVTEASVWRAEPEVVQPTTHQLAVDDRPLHQLTHAELVAKLTAINESTRLATPLNEAPGPRPALTERQMTQREAELARGAERNRQHAANQGPRRPPLTSLVPGRQDPLPRPPLPTQSPPVPNSETSARAPDDNEYVPDMNHGYVEDGMSKAFNERRRGS